MITLFTTLVCSSVLSQYQEEAVSEHQETSRATAPRYESLSDLMDGEVRLMADVEAYREAAEDGETPERPAAAIEDVIIDQGGEIRFVSLSVGGWLGMGDKVVLVPQSRLEHVPATADEDDDAKLLCSLRMTVEELEALPEFDAEEALENRTLDRHVTAAEATFPREPKRGLDEEATEREASAPKQRSYMLASELLELDIDATDGEFGSVTDAAVDVNNHSIDLLIVSHGGALGVGDEHFLIPIAAATMVRDMDDDGDLACSVPMTIDELEAGIRFEESDEDGAPFVSAATCKMVHQKFGTQPRSSREMRGENRGGERDDDSK